VAAIAAGALEINHDGDSAATRQTLAFDLMNGGVGTLNACHVAVEMIRAGRTANALVLAAEIENNAALGSEHLVGLKETGSALMLEPSTGPDGFGRFVFRAFPANGGDLDSHTVVQHGATALRYERSSDYERHLIEGARAAVAELLDLEGLTIDALARVFPPHRSRAFVAELAAALGLPLERFVLLPDDYHDYFTSSLAATFEVARSRGLIGPGDVGLVIAAGAGVQVGCATYHFG
jgi:3-oxoacyl-[acyl-carrier-protein] synthase III